jgi:enoyl-CoA hydratase/carnithine racemase
MNNIDSANNDIVYEVADDIATLTFNRPEARNALTFEMYDVVASVAENLQQQQGDIKALIVTGSGDKAFAAGTDISRFRDFSTAEHALNYERNMDKVLNAFESIPVPTIAAINGACTGGGAAIAACCDLRIASETLKFGFPIARTLGNCLSASNISRLVSLLGTARTREIIFTSRLIQSDEALAIGLVSEVTSNVVARARELAEQMKGHAPLTMIATKETMRRLRESSSQVDCDDLIISCYTSRDFKEGLEAFLAKRRPEWQGC